MSTAVNKFRCTATGDSMITRRLPAEGEYEGFSEVRNFIMQGDFRYGNLETTVHNFESYGAAQSGGSWLCAPPGVLKDMRKFGMNVLCTANNHALDYAHGGLVRTIEYLDSRVVAPIVEEVSGWDEPVAIAILPDHPTPCEHRTHTADPVPFLIYYPGIEADGVETFDEVACKQGACGVMESEEFMKEFMCPCTNYNLQGTN